MSHTGDLYSLDFPHGTVDGYRQGCHGSVCGAVIACRDVYRRYQGDFSFRKLIDAGMTVVEIAAREEADREAARERDREAARAERRRIAAASRPKQTRAPRAPREPRVLAIDKLGPEVARLHAEGMLDAVIAEELGIARSYVGKLRRDLGLLPHARPRVGRAPRAPRHDRRADVARLHGEGLNDVEVAAALSIGPRYAAALRRELELPAHVKPRERKVRQYQPRRDRRPDVAAAHADGLTDRAIAERIGIGVSEVGRLRRDLGLTVNAGRRGSRWDPSKLQPHGTNASYARGCRCEACHQAQREYYREYTRKRRAAVIPEKDHGTPYGYQLGCRSRKTCPAEVSCIDAVLEEDRRRRREAGVAEQAPRVPAQPVREHVRALLDGGRSVLAIAEEAGVSKSGLKTLLYGRSGERKGELPEHIEAEKAERLLALGRSA